MTYEQITAELESRGMMPNRPPGIESTRQGFERLGLPIDPEHVVLIAGTNGKGSTAATLEALLLSAGCHVGLYTSPHLVDHTERIRIDGSDLSRDLFCEAYRAVQEHVADLDLSHFEMVTLMAAWCFASAKPKLDWILLEVGLGGTWDATNAIPHAFCVITPLGMDHENLLGSTLVEIARNKFGIVGTRATVVHAPLPSEEVEALSRTTAKHTKSRWIAMPKFEWRVQDGGAAPRFWLKSRWGEGALALPGRRAAENANLALATFETLGFKPSAHLKALSKVRWPGRMERIAVPEALCPVYLSGDHNPQGIQSLIELLPCYPRKHLHLLVGVGRDKDLNRILDPLLSLPNASIYLTETPFKGRTATEYGGYRERVKGLWADPNIAMSEVLALAEAEDLIIVTGSLYLVGHYLGEVR